MSSNNHMNPNDFPNSALQDDPHQFSFQNNEDSPKVQVSSYHTSKNIDGVHMEQNLLNNSMKNKVVNDSYEERREHSKRKSVIIHIKLGADVTKEIKCDLDDDVLELARNFCLENNLSAEAVPVIIKMIRQQFGVMLQRMKDNTKRIEHDSGAEKKRSTGSETNEMSLKQKLVGKIDVSIGPGQSRELLLFQSQDPFEAASQFCRENDLPVELVEVLGTKLKSIKQSYENSKKKKSIGELQNQSNTDNEPGLEAKTATFGGLHDSQKSEGHHQIEPSGQPNQFKNPFSSDVNMIQKEQSLSSPNFNSQEQAFEFKHSQEKNIPEVQNTEPEKSKVQAINLNGNEQENMNKNRYGNEGAMAYERWSNLIKEKNKLIPGDTPSFGVNTKEQRWNQVEESKYADKLRSNEIYKEALTLFGDKIPISKELEQELKIPHTTKDAEKKLTRGQQSDVLRRLYYDELTKKTIVEEMREKTITKREQQEAKELTFHPKINKSPRQAPDWLGKRSPDRYQDHKMRVIAAKETKTKTTQENFTFRPKISDLSIEIANNRARSRSPIHNKLYDNGVAQKNVHEKWRETALKEMLRFRPDLPGDMNKFLQNRPKEDQKEFVNRLVHEAKEKEERRMRSKIREDNNLIDPKTGQKYYQPVISHDKYYHHLKKREEEENAENKRSKTPEDFRMPKLENVVPKSELRELFERLDSDHDGYISAKRIDLSQLNSEALEAILGLVEILEKSQSQLDFKEFISAVMKLNLEDKILNAMRTDRSRDSNEREDILPPNSKFFLEQISQENRSPNKTMSHEAGSDEMVRKKKNKVLSGRSDLSTASSNQTEKSMSIPKHYQELLNRKNLV